NNVAYIPKFENLISSSLLIHSGQVKPFYQDWDHIVLELIPSGRKIRIQGYNHCYPIQIININGNEAKALAVLKDNTNPINQIQLSKIMLLHKQLGHISPQSIIKLIKNNAITASNSNSSVNINELTKISNLECVICALGKGHRKSFTNHSNSTVKAKHVMFRLHADITGPMNQGNQSIINGLQEFNYYSVIVDEYSNYIFGKPIKFKDETDSHVMQIIRHYEKLVQQSVVFIRCDGGGEYKSKDLLEFLSNKGIVKETTTPHTPQHNGKAERTMRTLSDIARSIMIHSNSPTILWSLAYDTAVFIYNRTHVTTIESQTKLINKTPYELVYGIKPSISYLKSFGCNVTFNNNDDKHKTKLDQRQYQGIMVGYDPNSDSRQTIYKILDYDTLTIIRSRDVTFFESDHSLMNSLRLKLADELNINSHQLRKADEQFYQQWIWNNYEHDSEIMNESKQLDQSNNINQSNNNESEIIINDNQTDAKTTEVDNHSVLTNNSNSNDTSININYYADRNVLRGYQMNDTSHRERWLKTYVKPIVNNATAINRMKSVINIHQNADKIPWSKISKNETDFLNVCKEFLPNKLQEIQSNLMQYNAEASNSRVTRNPNPLNSINYESKELLHEGTDIFGDAPLTDNNVELQAHSVITHENSELVAMSINQLSGTNVMGEFEPSTYEEAIECIDNKNWKLAMDQEINALVNNVTWTLTSQLPEGRKAIPCKWVYKIKYNENGKPIRYKARLVVKGFMQKYGVDYNETYAPVMKYDSLRLLLAIATILDLELKQFDVDNAFLNAVLNEDIYMQQPEGYINDKFPNAPLKLLKSLYGLKQAPYEWNDDINETLIKLEFKRCASDSCVYYYENTFTGKPILIGLFVDDIIVSYDTADEVQWLKIKSNITQKYKIKEMGDAKFILGIRIIRDRDNKTLKLDQSAYIDKILNKFDMKGYKHLPASRPGTKVMDLKFDENEPILPQQLINRYQQM
ncbi:MAG: reverse transcriptase domain-containing protein, partial [Nitrososphaeraceae archaeon]